MHISWDVLYRWPWYWLRVITYHPDRLSCTVYPKKYVHGFCFAVLCCGYTLTDVPISIRLTSLALWQSNDCPSASKATLMNMDKYFMWIHYERLHNHNKAKQNKTVCIFLGIPCTLQKSQVAIVIISRYFWLLYLHACVYINTVIPGIIGVKSHFLLTLKTLSRLTKAPHEYIYPTPGVWVMIINRGLYWQLRTNCHTFIA